VVAHTAAAAGGAALGYLVGGPGGAVVGPALPDSVQLAIWSMNAEPSWFAALVICWVAEEVQHHNGGAALTRQ
jgi:hypothetical protein